MLEEERAAKQAKRDLHKTGMSENPLRFEPILDQSTHFPVTLIQSNIYISQHLQGIKLPKVEPRLAILCSQYRGQVL